MKIFFTQYTLALCLSSICLISLAQSGPGGVGSSATNKIWYDANSLGLANNAPVSSWTDVSGNAQHASQATLSYRPLYKTNQLNGFPTVRFDGSNDHLQKAAASGVSNQPITWFIIGKFNNLATSQAMLHFSHNGTSNHKNLRFTVNYNSGSTQRINSGNLNTSGGGTPSNFTYNTATKIMSTLISNTTINTYTNGTQTGTNTGTFLSPVGANLFVTLGRRAFLNDMPLNGDLAEVIVYNYELTGTQRILVENYLSSKYALALTANDHYALEGTGHYYKVSGIGMEGGNSVTDAEGGSLVRINSASSLANGDYLLWGHDNASLTVNSTNVPAIFSSFSGTRLNRTWRVDETGDVGNYTLAVNMSSMPALGASTSDYVLMIDDDGDFSNGGTTYHTTGYTYVGGTATWTGVNMPDNSYFTVAYLPAIISVTTGNWNDQSTWSCNCIPGTTDDAYVLSTHTVTVDDNSFIQNLTVEGGGSLDFADSYELNIAEDLNVQGSFDGTLGIVNFNGSVAQTITVGGTAIYGDLNLDNAAGLTCISGVNEIHGTLGVYTGEFDSGSNLVTLFSDATSTARIDEVSGTLSGTLTMQRYVSARADGYSDLSSPMSDATFAQLDDDFEIAFTPYVEYVSIPSIWGYDESDWDFYAIETSTTAMLPGIGYEAYLDNDGSEATSFAATTLDITGTPNYGDVPVAGITADNDGWNLIGNPYASFIDFTTFRTNAGLGMGASFLFYDETIEDYNMGGLGDEIAPGEGFWIEASAGGTVTFHENNKSTTNTSDFRSSKETMFSLRVVSDETKYTSNTYIRFNESADQNYVSGNDLSYLKVPAKKAPSLFTLSSDGKNLRINELAPVEELSIPLNFVAGFNGDYTIKSFNSDIALLEGYNVIILEDKKTGIFHPIHVSDYSFNAEIEDEDGRFVIHFKKSAAETVNDNTVLFSQTSEGTFVNFNQTGTEMAFVSVFNTAGQEISPEMNISASGINKVNLPESYQGIFIVRVIISDKVYTQRFYKP